MPRSRATQQVRSGNNAPLRAPDQDQIVVDDIVVRPLRHHFQMPNDIAEPRLHIPLDQRPMPTYTLNLTGLSEQSVTQEMMGIQHEGGLTAQIGDDNPLLA